MARTSVAIADVLKQPALTPLDERVLNLVNRGPGATRTAWIAQALGEPRVQVQLILSGLAHLGYIRRVRGGWWRSR